MPREPITYRFSDKEAVVVRRAFHKQSGQGVYGVTSMAVARVLEQKGLLSVEVTNRSGSSHYSRTAGGLIIRLTPAGREAWLNAGLIAAGRPPVCLS